MSVHRIMGVETEYGISAPNDPGANPVLLSSQVVNAYAQAVMPDRPRRMRWDYDVETPLRDARGFDMSRSEADPSQLTDDDYGLANVVLFNGARFYVDHAHPEYSSPEVTNPRDAALWDVAGDRIMERSAQLASELTGQLITVYKNNSDGKGVSYGAHENYHPLPVVPVEALAEIGADSTPQILVLNKADAIEDQSEASAAMARIAGHAQHVISISARTGQGVEELLAKIDSTLGLDPVERCTFRFPVGEGSGVHMLHEYAKVLSVTYDDQWCTVEAEAPASIRRRLAEYHVNIG